MEVRYRYRLRVNPTQERLLHETFAVNRFVWNHMLGRWTDLWRHEGASMSTTVMHAELTDLRNTEEFDWLRAVPVVSQQQTIRDLGKAISAFFDKQNPAGRPRFKHRDHSPVRSARWTRNRFGLETIDGRARLSIALPGGRQDLRVVWSRPLPSTPTSVTVSQDPAGRWWASFVVRIEPDARHQTGRSTGVDVGLNVFATTEDPAFDVPNPRFARQAHRDVARASKRLARTEKGSNRRHRARHRKARIEAAVADRRRDHHHKTARTLAREFDTIGIEDLQVRNMARNHHLARSISDTGWSEWALILEHQARKAGSEVVRMDPRNTTQMCSDCGTKAKVRLGLRDRVFCCQECGLVLDRDRNAARNLNPGRAGPGVGVDGSKTVPPAGVTAA